MHALDGTMREATAADALAIAELWLRSRHAAPGVPLAAHADNDVRAWFRDVVVPAGGVWVVGDRDAPDAVMVLRGDWVEQLYVAPEGQRQGHGSRLAQSLRGELSLWTFEANTSARAFYEAHGFAVDGPVSTDNEEHAPAVRYRWFKPFE
jgi:GNAT superfamily N-acetyltransferase